MNKHQSIYDSIIKSGHQDRNTAFVFEVYHGRKSKVNAGILFNKISILEKRALDYLKRQDRILDIGAGAGRISIYLQRKGYNITALDKSRAICKVLKKRDIRKIINADIFKYTPKRKYDVVLFIKVYAGFDEKKENIDRLLKFLIERVLVKNGRLIFFLSETKSRGTEFMKRQLIFKGKISPWLKSLHPSSEDIIKSAENNDLSIKKLERNNSDQYFLILKKNK
ncbi:MAG: class I SAM-dependent methyltransferase [Candidatus Portnoybacteria bacterium]|nr:class I SAM-dependent methyltransferase [Candidatus Portnoybacteria bacterium]